MSSVYSALLADISNLPWIPIIAIAGGMLVAIVTIVGGLITAHRRQAMWHETARLALEKGQPVPPLPDADAAEESAPAKREKNNNDIRSGLILIAVGAGLFIFLNALVSRGLGLVGAIPGFIGVALLLFGILNLFSKSKDQPPADRS